MDSSKTTRRNCLLGLGASLIAPSLLFGCGSGSGNAVGGSVTGKGKAAFSVDWPNPQTRLIPNASQSIKVTISDAAGEIASKILVRPAQGGSTTVTFETLPVGTLTATAEAFPNADGTGIAQASATVAVDIVLDQVATTTLALDSTIDHLEVTPAVPTVNDVMPQPLTLSPRDKNGRLVLVASSTVDWVSSDPATLTVSAAGTVRGLMGGTARITAHERESGKSVEVNVSVQELEVFPVYVGHALTPGLDLLLNTSGGLTDWLHNRDGFFEANYPPNQSFGFIAVSTYPVTPTTTERQTLNLTKFSFLSLEMKGTIGKRLLIGTKTESEPDNGLEPKFVCTLGADWQTYHIPLSQLVRDPLYPASRMTHLYILCELVFEQDAPSDLFFRNIRFEKSGGFRGLVR